MKTIYDDSFENCIKCTICTVYCPVSKENPDYPGPKQAGPDGERLRLKGVNFYDDALKYCTNCKRCEIACPSEVKIGDIIQRARMKYAPVHFNLRNAILSHTDFMGKLATPLAPIVNTTTALKPMKFLLDKTLKIDHRRQLPKYSLGTFRGWYKRKAAKTQEQFTNQVAFFHGCYVNYNNPALGKDIIRVFNALNIGVQLLDKETCCGVALIANNFTERAKKQATTNIETLTQAIIEKNIPVITTSSTCTLTLRDEYHHILNINTDAIRNDIELATRHLYRLQQKGKILPLKTLPIRVAYHTPCHMDKLGWANYTIALLKSIPGIEVIVLPSQCCGIAGTYGFKKENYDVAQKIGHNLFKQIEKSNVDLVITDCETCKWQIEMSTSKRCEHPITLLAQAINR